MDLICFYKFVMGTSTITNQRPHRESFNNQLRTIFCVGIIVHVFPTENIGAVNKMDYIHTCIDTRK